MDSEFNTITTTTTDFNFSVISIIFTSINIIIFSLVLIHIIYAIKTSIKVIKRGNWDTVSNSLFTIWFIPIFGSLAITKKEDL